MKRLLGIFIITATSSLTAFAQDQSLLPRAHLNMEIFNVCATIFVMTLVMMFVLSLLKRVFEFRIKNKIVEKGINENLASFILKPGRKEDGAINFKWFSILTGTGIGLTIVNYTLPLGVHSLAIMSFSIAASFLAYYFFLKRTDR